MSAQFLQITYKFSGTKAEFERHVGPVAEAIAAVPGLRWKIWLMDESAGRGGGSYLFDDDESRQAYLKGPIVAALRANPAFSELHVQSFAVLEGPTAVTRGPVDSASG